MKDPPAAGTFAYEPLTRENARELAQLFERVESSCYCRYFHFEGDKNAWQARLAFEAHENRRELVARAAHPTLAGVVARDAVGAVVGWMKLEPAFALPKLYAQRTYRSLPCFAGPREGVWVVGCLLVRPDVRRRGIARALLREGLALLRERGARAVEAFPRRAEGVRDEELWTGPFALYGEAGFSVVHEQSQYPVLRREL